MNAQRKRVWAEIDLDAARFNYQTVRSAANENAMVCCVIKANAYGHGAVELAKLYEKLGADWFAVSNIEEALQLRKNDIAKPILILGYTPAECADLLAENNISQCVYSAEYAKELSAFAVQQKVSVKIHVKLDTGMHRIGFMYSKIGRDEENLGDIQYVCALPGLEPQGIFTHFAVADEGQNGKAFTMQQFVCFTHAIELLEQQGVHFQIRHCANSAAIFDYPQTHLDMVRAGVVLYGIQPSSAVAGLPALRPVMQLNSVVSLVKTVPQGDSISYGLVYTAQKDRRIATVPIGYADGYRRANFATGTYMLLHGQKAPIVGKICMDQLMLDVTDIPDAERGDIVTVFGSNNGARLPVETLAEYAQTIPYELVCDVGERVPRYYFAGGEVVAVQDSIVPYEDPRMRATWAE